MKATMNIGLVAYSATVLIVTLAMLSMYLPAMINQARKNHHRVGSRFLQPMQGNFLMGSIGYVVAHLERRGMV